MKLEPLLARGRLVEGFETETVNGTVMTAHLFHGTDEKKEDVAYSVVYNIMKELVQSASETADSAGIKYLGLTGGVSYNSTITKIFMDLVSGTDHPFIIHNDVPNGDGGISIGQAAIAAKRV